MPRRSFKRRSFKRRSPKRRSPKRRSTYRGRLRWSFRRREQKIERKRKKTTFKQGELYVEPQGMELYSVNGYDVIPIDEWNGNKGEWDVKTVELWNKYHQSVKSATNLRELLIDPPYTLEFKDGTLMQWVNVDDAVPTAPTITEDSIRGYVFREGKFNEETKSRTSLNKINGIGVSETHDLNNSLTSTLVFEEPPEPWKGDQKGYDSSGWQMAVPNSGGVTKPGTAAARAAGARRRP